MNCIKRQEYPGEINREKLLTNGRLKEYTDFSYRMLTGN